MVQAQVPMEYRDYCAHHYIHYAKCQRTQKSWQLYKCDGEKHEWEHCEFDDFIMRMKEYERERRLRQRTQKSWQLYKCDGEKHEWG